MLFFYDQNPKFQSIILGFEMSFNYIRHVGFNFPTPVLFSTLKAGYLPKSSLPSSLSEPHRVPMKASEPLTIQFSDSSSHSFLVF